MFEIDLAVLVEQAMHAKEFLPNAADLLDPDCGTNPFDTVEDKKP